MARAGAILTIGWDGDLSVIRGFVRSEDMPKKDRPAQTEKQTPDFSANLKEAADKALMVVFASRTISRCYEESLRRKVHFQHAPGRRWPLLTSGRFLQSRRALGGYPHT